MRRLFVIAGLLVSLVAMAQEPVFKVGSFNLCTSGSRKSFVEKGKQGYIAGPQRYWCNSATAVADMIVALDCDILGVQEVCDSIWGVKGDKSLRPMVADRGARYEWILYPNSGKGTISYDVAIAYKPELLDTLATGIFWTGGHPDRPKTRKGEPKHVCKPCVWAHFVHKATGRDFYFLDTHTVVPTTYPDNQWPKNRGNILNLQEIRRVGESLVPEDIPSILVGDLNVAHTAPDWHWIGDGRWADVFVQMRDADLLSDDARAWGTQNLKDESGFGKWYPDHILLDGFVPCSYEIDRRKFPTSDGSLHYPSDHLPIVADVRMTSSVIPASSVILNAAKTLPQTAAAVSCDGHIRASVHASKDGLWYKVSLDRKEIIGLSPIGMTLSDGTVFGKGEPKKVIESPGEITLEYKGYALDMKVENDGVAWRWRADKHKACKIVSEQASFRVGERCPLRVSYTHKYPADPFMDDFENVYAKTWLPAWKIGHLGVEPVMAGPDGARMVITESDVVSYPGMFLDAHGDALVGSFAPYPRKEVQGGHNNVQMLVSEREPWIASWDGKPRNFPWRVICIGRNDAELAACDLVTRLATPSSGDFSWVKPGKVAWEWWNWYALNGVDFTPGVNTATYKAYIDFASRHGIEYVILDEGWATLNADDLFSVVPEIDLPEIVQYGASKGVGIILWAGYTAFVKDMERVCGHYAALGVKGFKVDFLDRNDQPMQEFMYKAAQTAARYKMVLDFHGCPPPTGLQKRFPNILNCEGIFGLEQMRKRALPEYDMVEFDVTAPFIRFLAGPADYTPGAFLNATREAYFPAKRAPMSQGTRCRQLAEYVVFDAPLQMLCDSPSRYEEDPDCADFIYRVPTTWDETRVLAGDIGHYVVMARRKDSSWYIGAMTDWMARDITIDLSFLSTPRGETGGGISVEAWEDGPLATTVASDWRKRCFETYGKVIKIHLAPGGGWAGIVSSDGPRFKDLNRNGKLDPYEDSRLSAQERAADLVSQLPPEYLSGLMTNGHTVNVPGISSMSVSGITYNGKPYAESGAEPSDICDRLLEALVNFDTRQVLLAHSDGPETIARWNNKVQKLCEELPFGIPCAISTDPRNEIKATDEYNAGSGGVCSQWPTPLGLAATFDPAVVRDFALTIKREYMALGFRTALSPQADLATDPRWRRVPGTFGENPELVKAMASAYVRTMQPEINCIIKHWPGGGTGEGGRDAHLAIGKHGVFPGGRLATHMDAFDLTAAGVMPYYTISWNQDPSGENVGNSYSAYMIDSLLRKRYCYEGIICTDWGIVPDYNGDPLTTGGKCYGVENLTVGERILKALEAGVDEFGGSVKASEIMQAWSLWCAKYGEASARQRWEHSARKILESMFRTGLFENRYVSVEGAVAVFSDSKAAARGEEAQRRSIVMVKNRALPVAKMAKVYIPKRQIPGVYSMTGRLKKAPYVGYSVDTSEVAKHYTIVSTPQAADFALVAITEPEGGIGYKDGQYVPISLQYSPYKATKARDGERSYKGKTVCVENATDLVLVKETKAAMGSKPVVVLLQTTRPVVMEFEPWADAVLVAFGVRSKAFLELVSGAFEPTGRLPMQFPSNMDTVEQQLEDVPQDMQPWKDADGNLYDFGFGLNWSGVISQ